MTYPIKLIWKIKDCISSKYSNTYILCRKNDFPVIAHLYSMIPMINRYEEQATDLINIYRVPKLKVFISSCLYWKDQ